MESISPTDSIVNDYLDDVDLYLSNTVKQLLDWSKEYEENTSILSTQTIGILFANLVNSRKNSKSCCWP